ncbi:MAG: restriction endonuclease subunit S [Deltaproteobacteria bacterium]|nr:restriction endonuclease subunit S [Deltaproteobacteria bacterium]
MTEGPYKLPSGWRWVRIAEVCEVNPRRPHLNRHGAQLTSFVPMNAIDEAAGKIADLEARPYAKVQRGYTYFGEGDVLFAKITPCMQNGKSAIARGLIDGFGFGSTEFHVLQPKEFVLAEWIWLFVRQELFREKARLAFRGAVGQQRVPQEFVENYPFPLPPLDEQRRIVAKIDSLMGRLKEARRLRAAARQDADRLMQSALAETFPRSGSELPKGWRWKKLGDGCIQTERRDPTKAPMTTFIYVDISSIDNALGKIVSPKEMKGAEAPNRARKVIRTEDVIFATTRPYLRNIAIVPSKLDDQICSTGFCVIRANRELAYPKFLFYLCRSDSLIDQLNVSKMRGASYPAVTYKDLYEAIIPLPTLLEQSRIVAHLEEIQSRVMEINASQSKMESELQRLEQSILDKAFRGKL